MVNSLIKAILFILFSFESYNVFKDRQHRSSMASYFSSPLTNEKE